MHYNRFPFNKQTFTYDAPIQHSYIVIYASPSLACFSVPLKIAASKCFVNSSVMVGKYHPQHVPWNLINCKWSIKRSCSGYLMIEVFETTILHSWNRSIKATSFATVIETELSIYRLDKHETYWLVKLSYDLGKINLQAQHLFLKRIRKLLFT